MVDLIKTRQWQASARERVKEVIDGPDIVIDRLIKTILQNDLKISKELMDEFPALQNRQVAARIRGAIASKRIEKGHGRAFRVRHV